MQFICMRLFVPCGNYFSRSFSSSARSFAISSGMPMCCGHTRAHLPQARQAAGRAMAGISRLFQKAVGAFRRGAAVVRFEQAGDIHPNGQGMQYRQPVQGMRWARLSMRTARVSAFCSDFVSGLEGRHRGKVVRKLFLAAHARKHHQHARQAGREADGPGRNAAAGRLRLQHRLGLRAQGSQRAAAHRLHHDARQAVFLQYFVLLPSALHGPVQIIQLQLGKIPRVGGAYRAQHGGLVVEREAQAADLPLGLFPRQKFKRAPMRRIFSNRSASTAWHR